MRTILLDTPYEVLIVPFYVGGALVLALIIYIFQRVFSPKRKKTLPNKKPL